MRRVGQWVRDAVRTRCGVRLPYEEMEEEYGQQAVAEARRFLTLWCFTASVLCLGGLVARVVCYGVYRNPGRLEFIIHFVPNLLLAVVWPLGTYVPVVRRHVDKLMSLTCFLLLATFVVRMVVMTQVEVGISYAQFLGDVLRAVQADDLLRAQLDAYVREVAARHQFNESILTSFFIINTVQFMGLRWHLAAVYVALPVMFVLASFCSAARLRLPAVLLFTLCIAFVALGWSLYVRRKQGQRFVADYMLQRSLEKEALALQEGMQRELTFMDMARRADTVLNHILKNTMADAAGCIQLYTQSVPSPMPPDLAQALSCLDGGMRWCKNRQALLRVSSGDYVPALTAVNLQEFGRGLVRGRPVACSFSDTTVMLDAVLCGIMLDNGLAYAFRLADAADPCLHFQTHLEALSNADPLDPVQGQLTFHVLGRAHPAMPPLTPDIVARLLSGELLYGLPAGTDMADHLGLQYMFLAAEAHGMDLFLGQDGDQIQLRLSLRVAILPPTVHLPSTYASSEAATLPGGLTVLVIDDSAIARRLLVHTLNAGAANLVVRAYGQSPTDVQDFLDAALAGADIVILDQHLDFGPVSYFGTELLQVLLRNGFTGFSCIRSANVSAENQAMYLQAGAGCAIGKDLHPDDLVRCLAAHYAQHLRHDPQVLGVISCGDSAGHQDSPLLTNHADSTLSPNI